MSKRKYFIDASKFINVQTPEAAYILGLIWADGTLGNKYSVTLTCIKEDLEIIKPVFETIGSWGYFYRTPRGCKNQKEQLTIYNSNKDLYNYLMECGYGRKSWCSANLILNNIPNNLKKYWWRGYSDGDGCFYTTKFYQFFITSGISQDWSFMVDLSKELNVNYKILQKTVKAGSYSRFMLTGIKNLLAFGSYIYDTYETDKIGFYRKFKKYQEVVEWKENKKYQEYQSVHRIKDPRYKIKKWCARFKNNKIDYFLGYFKEKEDAINAVLQKKLEIGLIKKIE